MMKNAITIARETMGDTDWNEALEAVETRSGVAFLSPLITYLGVPVEEDMDLLPLRLFDQPGERGLIVLIIAGDMRHLPDHFDHYRTQGFTHLIWSRGFKPGTKEWKRVSIDAFQKRFEACSRRLKTGSGEIRNGD